MAKRSTLRIQLDERLMETIKYLSERLASAEVILESLDFDPGEEDPELKVLLDNWHYQVTRQNEFL